MFKLRRPLIIIALTGLLVSVCTRVIRQPKPKPHKLLDIAPADFQRGMWLRAASMASPDSIRVIIEIAKRYEITDIYAQVIVGGYAYYPSEIVPRSQYLAKTSDRSYDPLDSLIHAAQACSIRVHAWVNTILAWSLRAPPDSTRHLVHTHPEWFIRDITMKNMVDYSADEWYDAGLEGMYLDPANPMVGDYLKKVCLEIIDKYPVVGIHLDFIRYPGVFWGMPFNDKTAMFVGLDAFNLRWFNLLKYPQSSFVTRWMFWHYWRHALEKEKHIHAIVSGIQEVMLHDSLPPGRIFTAAIFPNPGLARYRFAQNWMDWNDVIDYPVAMSYTDNVHFFAKLLDYTIQKRPDAIFGIGFIWPDMEGAAFLEVKDVIKNNGAGICFFDFTSLDTMVDFAKFNGEAPAEEYSPILEKEKPEPVTDIFYDPPPAQMVKKGKELYTSNEEGNFVDFLLSLSLDQNEDLQRMKITNAELLEKVRDDIVAFKVLDAQVFPIGDTLLTPPTKKVIYEFLPWDDQDTAVVKEKAQKTTELTKQITVYPNVLSDISRVSFSVNDGTKKTFAVRRGIYVLITKQSNNGGDKILRKDIPEELLPVYLSWTIENKVQSVLNRY